MGFSDPETAATILLSRSIAYRGIQDAWPFPSDGLLRMDYGLVEAFWGLRYIIGFVLSS